MPPLDPFTSAWLAGIYGGLAMNSWACLLWQTYAVNAISFSPAYASLFPRG